MVPEADPNYCLVFSNGEDFEVAGGFCTPTCTPIFIFNNRFGDESERVGRSDRETETAPEGAALMAINPRQLFWGTAEAIDP